MNARVLITGFEPFGNDSTNPSADVALALDETTVAGRTIAGMVLPVEFEESARRLKNAIRELDPELVICLGLAASRSAISLERVAVNLDDARIPDNAGQRPVDTPVVTSGPTAYLTTLPVKAMAAGLAKQGFPVELSSSAGNYVCNHVFYALMHALRRHEGRRGGFVHVPTVSERITSANLSEAVKLVVRIALETPIDISIPAGRID
tara:strand:+ start:5914 stop:6534 length:621 start_codon:yes stop_codon:yes gene_type:complete